MSDNRRCHRLNLNIPVTIKSGIGQKSTIQAAALDVSALGLCLVTKKEFKPGQKLILEVELPTKETAVIKSQVVWVHDMSKNFKVGIKILDKLEKDSKKFIMYFVSEFMTYDFKKE